jgi:tetratricopeptide (TPR) repeat protein
VVNAQTGVETNKLDADGREIVTRLNEPFLRALAAASGGRYLGHDLNLVPGAVDGRLRALESARIEERPTILPVERYQVFAGAALALLVLAALAERFARSPLRAGTAFAVLAVFLGGCATESYKANEAGREAMERGDYDTAIEKFLEVQVDRPDDPELSLNLASAYAAAGRQSEAIAAARRASASASSDVRARAFSSIGHHQFALEQFEESLGAFRKSLLEDPSDDDARHDYEVVLRLLFPNVEATPSPEATAEAADTPTPPANVTAGASPGSGSQGGIPSPVSGTPTPTGSGAGSGSPTPGSGDSAAELDRQLRQINQQVARLVQAAGDVPTPQEALEILRLLAQRSEIASRRDALGGRSGPKDY